MRARVRLLLVLACASACGFQALPNGDGGSDLASVDLTGFDLTGDDLTGGGQDFTTPGGGTGPGPTGALPAGFCCTGNDECRSRRCRALTNGMHVCTDDCDHDGICTAYGAAMKCDTGAIGECIAVDGNTTCVDASQYHYGSKTIGACCASGFDKSGAECVGGLCDATGPSSNPFFCTQGCSAATPCPGPYVCGSAAFCWLPDPNASYTCH